MLTTEEIGQMETFFVTKKEMEKIMKEYEETLKKCKFEIITEIRKIRKIHMEVSK